MRASLSAALRCSSRSLHCLHLNTLTAAFARGQCDRSEPVMLIRCLKLTAVANVVMKEDLPQTSPAWQLARQVVELAGAQSPSRPLELLEALWTDAAAGAENGGLTRCVPASAYLLAVFKALRCEDGLILERGACWIGMARAWRDGRVPFKQTDEPKAYEDLEREFQSLRSRTPTSRW